MSTHCHLPVYYLVLLPSLEVAAVCCSPGEALAWMETYNAAMAGSRWRAVIAQAPRQSAAA